MLWPFWDSYKKCNVETFEVIKRKAICWTDVEPDASEGTKNELWLKEAEIMCSFQISELLLNRHHCY